MISSPGLIIARKEAIIASVDTQQLQLYFSRDQLQYDYTIQFSARLHLEIFTSPCYSILIDILLNKLRLRLVL